VKGLEKIARILPAVLKGQVRRTEPPLIEVLAPLWPCVAGKAMAEHCRPIAFNQGTLTLIAECSTWRTQLQQMAEEIRAEVNSFLGKPIVRRLRVLKAGQRDSAEQTARHILLDKSRARWEDRAARIDPPPARRGRTSFGPASGRNGKQAH
jgi:predicted nucleic acid-binding Zn ribbon protein